MPGERGCCYCTSSHQRCLRYSTCRCCRKFVRVGLNGQLGERRVRQRQVEKLHCALSCSASTRKALALPPRSLRIPDRHMHGLQSFAQCGHARLHQSHIPCSKSARPAARSLSLGSSQTKRQAWATAGARQSQFLSPAFCFGAQHRCDTGSA